MMTGVKERGRGHKKHTAGNPGVRGRGRMEGASQANTGWYQAFRLGRGEYRFSRTERPSSTEDCEWRAAGGNRVEKAALGTLSFLSGPRFAVGTVRLCESCLFSTQKKCCSKMLPAPVNVLGEVGWGGVAVGVSLGRIPSCERVGSMLLISGNYPWPL